MKFFPIVAALLVVLSSQSSAMAMDRASLVQAESDYVGARQAEAAGQMEGARLGYQNALLSALMSADTESARRSIRLGGESLGNVARRALAIQKKLVERELQAPSGKYNAKMLVRELQHMYKTMEMLEPDNPTWLYLDAVMITNQQNYIKASGLLRRAINLPGGSPEVKSKAKNLLAHIKPAYDQQRAWFDEDWERTRQRMKEYAKHPVYISPDSFKTEPSQNWGELSPSSPGIPSWERQAQNAERQGDYSAADRFRSGGSSMSDGAKYNW